METKYLKPREGLLIRDPESMVPLSAKGEVKPWIGPEGRYWRRRVNSGDVLLSRPPKKSRPPTTSGGIIDETNKNGEEGNK